MDSIKILITGANGYIGKSLYNSLKDKYEVFKLTRDICDLTNSENVNQYFKDKQFDYVYSKEVLEHTPAPYIALCEINRVMVKSFAHFISTGIDKQREWYHFSCFPDWIWVDLFIKTGCNVKRIYENKVELGFVGDKIDHKDLDKKIDSKLLFALFN